MVVVTIIGCCMFFIREGLEKTVEDNIAVVRDIANQLVTSEVNLLVSQTGAVASRLRTAPTDTWNRILQHETEAYPVFKSITIFGRNGMIVSTFGQPQTPAELFFGDYVRRAFNGESVITTTRMDPSGELVFHILAPVADAVMSVAVSGLHFTELIEGHHLWKTGSIFLLDAEGTIIANTRRYMVLSRYNSLWDSSQSKANLSTQAFVRRMFRYPTGFGKFTLEGVERLGTFSHVAASHVDWLIGVSSPISESPAAKLDTGIGIMTILFLGLGALLAGWASGFVDRQFKIIEEQYSKVTELSNETRRASDTKTTFLATMSHEMRTPLNAIIGFSELMIHGHTDEADKEGSLHKIHTSGMILLGIVNDILDITKIEAGKFELVPVDYDLASLINDTVTVNLIRIGEKPIEFGLELDKTLPSRLFGDELRIKQIFNNLLSNAFKYTMEGKVDMAVSGHRGPGEDFFLTFTVADTGIGIKPEDLAKLFSEYSQLDTRSNRKIEGTGLGLAITKQLVDLMDGSIEVTSVYGGGSTFKTTLKQKFITEVPIGERVVRNLENLELTRGHQLSPDMSITTLPYARVLVVDDVKTNLDVAKGMLKPYGMQIDCVTSGQRAFELIRDGKPRYNAVFMDHMMPGMDGIETTRKIREEIDTDYARDIPVIALTANAIVGNNKLFLENGFQAFLSKPIDMKRMDVVLKQFVRDKEQEKAFLEKLAAEEAEMQNIVDSSMPRGSNGKTKKVAPPPVVPRPPERALTIEDLDELILESSMLGAGKSEAMDGQGGFAPLAEQRGGNGHDASGGGNGRDASGGGNGHDASRGGRGHDASYGNAVSLGGNGRAGANGSDGGGNGGGRAVPDEAPPGSGNPLMPDGKTLIQIDGLDVEEGLRRFSGDQEVYLGVIRSYAQSVAELFDQLTEPDYADLKSYIISIHGLKSSSYGICAKPVGELAEALEHKAAAGDLDFVRERNPDFLTSVRRLADSLSGLLTASEALDDRPVREAPDPEILERLKNACSTYDMDGVDKALADLGEFNYSADPDFSAWIKGRVDQMDFQEIVDRLSPAA
jgi:signal transduction histidine kinase/FixJ family two-component response regulator